MVYTFVVCVDVCLGGVRIRQDICAGGRWKLIMLDVVLSCDRETQDLTALLEETALLESRLEPHPRGRAAVRYQKPSLFYLL